MYCRLPQQVPGDQADDVFTADNLLTTCQIIFREYQLSSKIISDKGSNFTSDSSRNSSDVTSFTMLCFILQPPEKWMGRGMHKINKMNHEEMFWNTDVYHNLLQIQLTPTEPKLPSPVTLLFSRLAKGLLPKFNRPCMFFGYDDDEHYTALTKKQPNNGTGHDTSENILFMSTRSTVVIQQEEGTYGHMGP